MRAIIKFSYPFFFFLAIVVHKTAHTSVSTLEETSVMEKIREFFLRNFVFGLLTLLPIVATFYVFFAILQFSDSFLFNLLPNDFAAKENRVPGAGIILTIVIILATGVFTRNFFGKKMLGMMDKFISSIPVVKTIYNTIRQLLEGIFSMDRQRAFRKVVLLEYPRKGLFTLAFVAGNLNTSKARIKEFHTVFLPTSPNPTSGFFLMVPLEEVYDIDIRVEDAFRLIISGGVVGEEMKQRLSGKIEDALK